jgi:hypothetical protein
MEAPWAVERDQRLAVAVKVEGLGMKRGRAGQSEHGERSQPPEIVAGPHRPSCLMRIKRNVD